MAAPNSAQTKPSQMARKAPAIHPSIACGPPAAATMRGKVINGPTPIMSIMLRAVAPPRSTPRTNALLAIGSLLLAVDEERGAEGPPCPSALVTFHFLPHSRG